MDLQVFTNNNFSVIQQQVEKSKKKREFSAVGKLPPYNF
jgi:hypothetical protein